MTQLSRARILEAIALLEKVLQEDEPVGLEPGAQVQRTLRLVKRPDPYSFPGAPTGAQGGGDGVFGLETVRWHRKL